MTAPRGRRDRRNELHTENTRLRCTRLGSACIAFAVLGRRLHERRGNTAAVGPPGVARDMQFQLRMVLRCLYIDTADPNFLTLESPYQARFLDAAELARFVAQPEYGLTETFVTREVALGHECLAICDGDTLANYGWYSTTATHFTDDLSVRFGRDWVYMHNGFTHPAHRGRRLHAISMTRALTLYQARGFRGLVSIVYADNIASLKSCARMGYRHFGTIYTARLGRLLGMARRTGLFNHVFLFATPGCWRFGFHLDRRPVVAPSHVVPSTQVAA
jgi:hypothetical protein